MTLGLDLCKCQTKLSKARFVNLLAEALQSYMHFHIGSEDRQCCRDNAWPHKQHSYGSTDLQFKQFCKRKIWCGSINISLKACLHNRLIWNLLFTIISKQPSTSACTHSTYNDSKTKQNKTQNSTKLRTKRKKVTSILGRTETVPLVDVQFKPKTKTVNKQPNTAHDKDKWKMAQFQLAP